MTIRTTHRNPSRRRPSLPWQPPDERWRQAQQLARSDIALSRLSDDPFLRDAVAFLRGDSSGNRPDAPSEALRDAIQAAFGPPALRLTLETGLLAAADRGQIGAAAGITEDALTWFERLFFDVNPRRMARTWILLTACRHRLPDDPVAASVLQLVRKLCFFGGPLIFAALHPLLDDLLARPAWSPEEESLSDEEAARGPLADRLRLLAQWDREPWSMKTLLADARHRQAQGNLDEDRPSVPDGTSWEEPLRSLLEGWNGPLPKPQASARSDVA